MSDAADIASENPLPAGWTELRPDAWECQGEGIRLSVHYSKATRLYTAIACSGEFFFSCSHLDRLQAATAEASRLGVLLHMRLTPPPGAQPQEKLLTPRRADTRATPEPVCRVCAALMRICEQCQMLRCDCLACLCFQGQRNPDWGVVRVIKPQRTEPASGAEAPGLEALCARCEGMELVDCDACSDELDDCPKCEGCGLIACPLCDEQTGRAHCYQPDTCSAHA